MSKTVIISIIVVILILVGGWYYWQGQSGISFDPNQPYAISDEIGGTSTSTTSDQKQGSLKSLLSLGGAEQCDVTIDLKNVDSTSKVYVANGKMRGDIISETGGVKSVAHVIVDGNTMYNWMDGGSTGVKFNLAGASGTIGTNAAVNLDQNVGYNCRAWTADNSKFVVPANVTFSDFGAMMPKVPTGY